MRDALVAATIDQFPEVRVALVSNLGSHVLAVGEMLAADETLQRAAWPRPKTPPAQLTLANSGCSVDPDDRLETFAVIGKQISEIRSTQPQRLFQHRLEDRRQVSGRGVDDLHYLRDGAFSRLRLP
jgi:hypothetical protein